MDRNGEAFDKLATLRPVEPRRAVTEVAQESVVALVDQSRLRRECLKLALTEHESAWRILDLASAEDVLRLAEGGQGFDLLLLGAATAELVDLQQVETLRQAMPDTPVVVAKGKNYLALRIRTIARENGVPVVENPLLAQALYKSVDVGREIPPHLYRAVAEVLAYIYKLTRTRSQGPPRKRL